VDALVGAGCAGIVALGSLGEGGSLSYDEKKAVLRLCKEALAGRASLVAGVAALTTAEAERLAELGREQGADGLMVLPPYVYKGDWPETRAHFEAVIAETSLPCMLYNNPIAYGTDVSAEELAHLAARHPNLRAVKESSGDIRRVTAIRALLKDRLAVFMGVDDLIVEGVAAGAVGWIAGLVNAFPRETVAIYRLTRARKIKEATEIYRWFMPLLELDIHPKLVQYIKLAASLTDLGTERVRAPRLMLSGEERTRVIKIINDGIASRPALPDYLNL
jgi:4-hydroxy-tetrahydrodipicolinate synthase